MPGDWENDEKRSYVLRAVRHALRETGAFAYGHVAEAWLARASSDPEVAKLRPMERMDRDEVVGLTVVFRDGAKLHRLFQILRDQDGAVRLGSEDLARDAEIGGTLMNLFGED